MNVLLFTNLHDCSGGTADSIIDPDVFSDILIFNPTFENL